MATVLSIGALSSATGVPPETLRTWERRYGFPRPVARKGSVHRRYPLETVARLRLSVQALERGHKPSVVLRANAKQLRELLELAAPVEVSETSDAVSVDIEARVQEHADRLLEASLSFDAEGLVGALQHAWNDLGSSVFLEQCAGPLITRVGKLWEEGQLSVAQEHFATEQIRAFLFARWSELSERAKGVSVVCATPSGELHVLGLHLAAAALAAGDARVVFLGASTPAAEVIRAARDRDARAVALSASRQLTRAELVRYLAELRAGISSGVSVLAGGAGFERLEEGVLKPHTLRALTAWARTQQAAPLGKKGQRARPGGESARQRPRKKSRAKKLSAD
jgi:methanogenic corrinoid protein MtbC1